jgi:transcriptional regulator with XRE-family HTH domain
MGKIRSAKQKDALYVEVGRLIRAARKAKSMTQEGLGALVGLSRTSITNIELGRQRLFLDTLHQIADKLGIQVASLFPKSGDFSLEQRVPSNVSNSEFKWIEKIVEGGRRAS